MNGQLDPSDYTGMSFWIISAAMVAATFFFWVERDRAVGKWKTSLTVAAMVTGIAAIHYFYMRGVWASTGETPTVFRYVDWLLTVPLQIIEFYLILAAIAVVQSALFWRLLIASIIMLVAGYLGEAVYTTGVGPAAWGLISGIAYFVIVYDIWMGEAKKLATSAGGATLSAHNMLCKFVLIGWAIYPIGYMAGTEGWYSGIFGGLEMDVIYNVGDAINKIGFGLVVYNLAVQSK